MCDRLNSTVLHGETTLYDSMVQNIALVGLYRAFSVRFKVNEYDNMIFRPVICTAAPISRSKMGRALIVVWQKVS